MKKSLNIFSFEIYTALNIVLIVLTLKITQKVLDYFVATNTLIQTIAYTFITLLLGFVGWLLYRKYAKKLF